MRMKVMLVWTRNAARGIGAARASSFLYEQQRKVEISANGAEISPLSKP